MPPTRSPHKQYTSHAHTHTPGIARTARTHAVASVADDRIGDGSVRAQEIERYVSLDPTRNTVDVAADPALTTSVLIMKKNARLESAANILQARLPAKRRRRNRVIVPSRGGPEP